MSRPIKFRAWFPKEHYSEPHMAHLDINDDFGGNSATWQLRYLQHPEPDGPIYMQYTGLKDRNGVEIYEGDILPDFYDEEGVSVIVWDEKDLCWSVDVYNYSEYTNEGGSEERGPWGKVATEPLADFKDCEVIGNIYENPELLA